ncbi:hypothetical protein HDV00_007985 [Rhizophlyctis rosea]|nr:hypothetical protein HDV00_007985 [Rhizophlyctis rosea]
MLPPEISWLVARWSDPTSARDLRAACCKTFRRAILLSDLVFGEACWRLYYRTFDNCWYWAARNGHADVIRKLNSEARRVHLGNLLTISFANSNTVLMKFALDGLVQYALFENQSYLPQRLRPLLAQACGSGSVEIVQLLLDYGSWIHDGVGWAGDGLFQAINGNHVDVVKLLLKAGADIIRPLPLVQAVSLSGVEIVGLIIRAGADMNAVTGAPLRSAVSRGNCDLVKLLLDAGATARGDVLALAASFGDIDIVSILLRAGADVNADNGWALRSAAHRGDSRMAHMLLQAGANIHARDDEALLNAATRGHTDMVKLLLEAGSNV